MSNRDYQEEDEYSDETEASYESLIEGVRSNDPDVIDRLYQWSLTRSGQQTPSGAATRPGRRNLAARIGTVATHLCRARENSASSRPRLAFS